MATTTSRKRLVLILCVLAMCALAIALVACNGNSTAKVNFMIQNDDGSWAVHKSVTANSEGKVEIPAAPERTGYRFRDWYADENFSAVFVNEGIKKNTNVYAKYDAITLAVSVNGSAQGNKRLVDIDEFTAGYVADAESKNLTFGGWYIDSQYKTAYNGQDVDAIYARYMAAVTYDNGYETVYSELIVPGNKVTRPATESVKKYYMDAEDISYVDANGVVFDFSAAVENNTVVTVRWKSPFLYYSYDSNSGKFYVEGISYEGTDINMLKSVPVISVLSEGVTIGEDDMRSAGGVPESAYGSDREVFGISALALSNFTSLEKIILPEGIEYITGVSGGDGVPLKKLSLPESVVLLEGAFCGFTQLEEVNMKSGVEVIMRSFFKDMYSGQHDFDITVPASVKHISDMPTNLTFEAGSAFYKEGDGVYTTDQQGRKVLVSYRTVDESGTITVPEEVQSIQAGAFYVMEQLQSFKRLVLPSSFEAVNYGANRADYDFYNGHALLDHQYLSNPQNDSGAAARAYSVICGLELLDSVLVNTREYPAEMSAYAFTSSRKPYDQVAERIFFVGAVEQGSSVKFRVTAYNSMDPSSEVQFFIDSVTSGQTIDESTIWAAIEANTDYNSAEYEIVSLTEFGKNYVASEPTIRNRYLVAQFANKPGGARYEYSESEGGYIVTAYDTSTALALGDGTYRVVIPAEYQGKPVVKIAVGAFKNAGTLAEVYIGKNVKIIDDEAFMNTTNLKTVSITPGGIEVIGRSAFENSGFTHIALPLATLKEVRPYAFKSAVLKGFLPVEGEEQRMIFTSTIGGTATTPAADLAPGKIYFNGDKDSDDGFSGLIQYVSHAVEYQKALPSDSEATVPVTVYEAKFLAVAGGMERGFGAFALGFSMRKNSFFGASDAVIRYEMMEGSVYYLSGHKSINFGLVSKVHKNAFTDMDAKYDTVTTSANGSKTGKIKVYRVAVENPDAYTNNDSWLLLEDIQAVASPDYDFAAKDAIFEDGWWEGITVDDADYAAKMEFMAVARYDSSMLGM